jgi:hypothetical protein
MQRAINSLIIPKSASLVPYKDVISPYSGVSIAKDGPYSGVSAAKDGPVSTALIPYRRIRWMCLDEVDEKIWHPRIFRITCLGNCKELCYPNEIDWLCGKYITRAGTGTSNPNANRKEFFGKLILLDCHVNMRKESKPQYIIINPKPVVQKIKKPLISEVTEKETQFLKAHDKILTTSVDPELRKVEIIETVDE